MTTVLKLEPNLKGRDYAVGDIHGCFSLLEEALVAAQFNPKQDRLIAVGDLVNRGPESHRALEFIEKDWFYTVRGDHEDDIPADIVHMHEAGIENVADDYKRQGMGWLLSLGMNAQNAFVSAFTTLPYAIEVPLKEQGHAGFIHAEIPISMSWNEFTAALAVGDANTRHSALKGRSRIIAAYPDAGDADPGIIGIEKLFFGHSLSSRRGVFKMANCYCLDTGADGRTQQCHDFPDGIDREDLHLSLIDINADPETLCRLRPQGDIRPYHVIKA